tara:strand:- start:37 stop:3411 length:3375 start_codon:yes stop_codon:yes gene_type:complete
MKCNTNKIKEILDSDNFLFILANIYEYINNKNFNIYIGTNKKFINNNNIISVILDDLLLKLYYLHINCKLDGYIYIIVDYTKFNFLQLELKNRNIQIYRLNLDKQQKDNDTLILKILIKDIQKIYELTNLPLITNIDFLQEPKPFDYKIFDKSVNKYHIRYIMYGWKPKNERQFMVEKDMISSPKINHCLHEYLPPKLQHINNYIRDKQKDYWQVVYDDGLIISREINNIVKKYKQQYKGIYSSKELTSENILNSLGYNINTKDNFYDDFSNNDRNTQFTVDRDKRQIISVISGSDPNSSDFKNIQNIVAFKDSSDLYNEHNKKLNLYMPYNHKFNYGFNDQKNSKIKSFNSDNYGSHGTPVSSSACGYYYGIAPNVNLVQFNYFPIISSERPHIIDYLDSEIIDSKFRQLIRLSNNTLNYTNIAAINCSYGMRFNVMSQTKCDIHKYNKNLRNNKLINLDESDKRYLVFIAAGNQNYECKSVREEIKDEGQYCFNALQSGVYSNFENIDSIIAVTSGSEDNDKIRDYPIIEHGLDKYYENENRENCVEVDEHGKSNLITNYKYLGGNFIKKSGSTIYYLPKYKIQENKLVNQLYVGALNYKNYSNDFVYLNNNTGLIYLKLNLTQKESERYDLDFFFIIQKIEQQIEKEFETLVYINLFWLDNYLHIKINSNDLKKEYTLIRNIGTLDISDSLKNIDVLDTFFIYNTELLNNNKTMTTFSSSSSPSSNYNMVDFVAPGVVVANHMDDQRKFISGTSFSSPIMSGLSILVRCLVEYFIEKKGYPEYLRTKDMIANIMRESAVKIKDENLNYFNTLSQGSGVVCLYNVYIYLRDNSKENFIDPFEGLPNPTTQSALPVCNSNQKETHRDCTKINKNTKDMFCSDSDTEDLCPVSCGVCRERENYTSIDNPILRSIGQNYVRRELPCENNNDGNTVYFNLDENECRDYVHYSRTPYINTKLNKWVEDEWDENEKKWVEGTDKAIDFQIKENMNEGPKYCISNIINENTSNKKIIFTDILKKNSNDKYICKKVIKKNNTNFPPCYLRDEHGDIVITNSRQMLLKQEDNNKNSCISNENFNFKDYNKIKKINYSFDELNKERSCKKGFIRNENWICVSKTSLNTQPTT